MSPESASGPKGASGTIWGLVDAPGTHLPTVDLSPILAGGLETASGRAVLDEVRGACSGIGFMTVTGHGVPGRLVEEMDAAVRRFFALGRDDKLAVAPQRWSPDSPNRYRGYFPASANGKEGFDVGDPSLGATEVALLERPYYEVNRFPASLGAGWQSVVARYFDALSVLGRTLMELMVASLGGDPDRVARGFDRPRALSTLRFNFYPKSETPVEVSAEDGAELSCETHVDSGIVTVLYQDRNGGLQVRDRDGDWIDVPFDPDCFVVNTGLAVHRMTNRTFSATPHRVLFCESERVSIPFFFEPAHDFEIAPRSLGLPEGPTPEGVPYEEFLSESLAKFAEYDRD